MDCDGPVLVMCATAPPCVPVANALPGVKRPVRILVRNADAPAALPFADRGTEVVQGSLESRDDLENAMTGADGVFSAPLVGGEDDRLEMRLGRNVIAAAVAKGVPMFHRSVARAGEHEDFVRLEGGRWWTRYRDGKATLNNEIRTAGLARFTS